MRWILGVGVGLVILLGVITLFEVVKMREEMEAKPPRVVVQEVTVHVERDGADDLEITGKRYEGQSIPDFLADLDRMVEEARSR